MTFSAYAALAQAQSRANACRCPYCVGASGPMQGCPCPMCQRARSNANLAALQGYGLVGGDVSGYGQVRPQTQPVLAQYGQRAGGCGCNGTR